MQKLDFLSKLVAVIVGIFTIAEKVNNFIQNKKKNHGDLQTLNNQNGESNSCDKERG